MDKRAVVIRMVFLAQPGSAVVASSGAEGCLVKRIYYRTISSRESDMYRRFPRLALRYPKVRLASSSKARRAAEFHQARISERRQCFLKKSFALGVVRYD